jgi:ankyrin repeat protein
MQDECSALKEAASKGRGEVVSDLLRHTEFSEAVLLDALVSAGASGKEQLVLDLIQHILDNSDSPDTVAWPISLIYRAAWLGLDSVAEKLLQLGVSPNADVPWTAAVRLPPLYQAARNSHLTTMRLLVSHGADVRFLGERGRTILHMVAGLCDAKILRWLVQDANFELESRDQNGRSPVYFPAVYGDHAALKQLLQLDADPNMGLTPESESVGWSPLVVAAEKGFTCCVKLLLEHNAHPNIAGPSGPTDNGTALRYAAIDGHVECCRVLLIEGGADPNSPLIQPPIIVQTVAHLSTDKAEVCLELLKLLIDNGADVNARDWKGSPVLSRIRIYDNVESIYELLLDRGADVNLPDGIGRTPLFHAAHLPKPALVKLLLTRGAEVNAVDEDGFSPLHAGIPSPEVVRLLLEHGANPALFQGPSGFTPVAYAASYAEYLDSLKLLIQHNAPLEADSGKGDTPLRLALSDGSAAAVRALAEAGANLQHTDKHGTPVLHHAVACGSDKLGAILEFLDRLDLNQTDSKGRTILYCGRIDLSSFKRVITAGAAINARDFDGYTPLAIQAMLGNIQHAKHLLTHGADVNLLSKHHGGPLHLAARYTSDLAMVKLLVEHGADVNLAAPVPGTPLAAVCLYSDPTTREDDKAQQRQVAVIRHLLEHNANASGQSGVLGYPINAAACSASPEAIRLLLSKGARIDAQNAMGVSPIHLAAFHNLAVFQSIVAAGGDPQARDLFGRTPLHWAAQPGGF